MLLWIYKKNTQFQNSLSGTILKDCSTKPFVHFMPGHGALRDTKGSEHPSGQRRKRRNHQVGKCHFVKDTLSLRLGLAMSGHLQEQKWNNLQNHDIIQVGSWQDGTHIFAFQVPLTGNRIGIEWLPVDTNNQVSLRVSFDLASKELWMSHAKCWKLSRTVYKWIPCLDMNQATTHGNIGEHHFPNIILGHRSDQTVNSSEDLLPART